MSVLVMDGYDHYDTMSQKWLPSEYNSCQLSALGNGVYSYGRYLLCSNGWYILPPAFTAAQTLIFCSHVYFESANQPGTMVKLLDSSTDQCILTTEWSAGVSAYRFNLKRGVTSVATTAYSYQLNTWYWISWKVTIDPTVGLCELNVNGVTQATFSGNTRSTANSTANQVYWGIISGYNYRYDNTVVMNSAGTFANDHLPESRVYFALPTANDVVQWTPSTGTNWQNVDENPPNSDTDYNSDSTIGNQDTFTATPGLGSATVLAMQCTTYARKDDASARAIRNVIKSVAAVADNGSDEILNSTYTPYRWIEPVDPNTSAQWAAAAADAAKIGYKTAA